MTCMTYTWRCRSKSFYPLFSAMLLTELLVPPRSYATMQYSLWLPYLICMLSLAMSFPILLAMPEKLKMKSANGVDVNKEPAGYIYKKVGQDRRLICALIAIFMIQFRVQTLNVLLLYTSKRFKWNLSQAC